MSMRCAFTLANNFSINTHIYKLSFANVAMTAAHKVSAAKESINNAEKRQQ